MRFESAAFQAVEPHLQTHSNEFALCCTLANSTVVLHGSAADTELQLAPTPETVGLTPMLVQVKFAPAQNAVQVSIGSTFPTKRQSGVVLAAVVAHFWFWQMPGDRHALPHAPQFEDQFEAVQVPAHAGRSADEPAKIVSPRHVRASVRLAVAVFP